MIQYKDGWSFEVRTLPKAVWLAGESCLSEYSTPNPLRMKVYACDKKKISAQAITVVDPAWENTDGCVQLELWKYSPEPFAKKGRVDTIFLYCPFKRKADEKVQGAREMMLEGDSRDSAQVLGIHQDGKLSLGLEK